MFSNCQLVLGSAVSSGGPGLPPIPGAFHVRQQCPGACISPTSVGSGRRASCLRGVLNVLLAKTQASPLQFPCQLWEIQSEEYFLQEVSERSHIVRRRADSRRRKWLEEGSVAGL